MNKYFIITIVFLTLSVQFIAQNTSSPNDLSKDSKKGQLYITWGYNRAFYNKSDIHFKGEGYDFTLEKARADDMPERFDPEVYFNITSLTIPQFNFRAGYYFSKNTCFSAGWDHMKYRLVTTQLLKINGYIDSEKYPADLGNGYQYSGNFNHEYILYNPGFMDYHHSDGFNYVRFSLEHRVPFWKSKNEKITAALNAAVSAGAMLPWTDWTFFGERNRNKLHIAGYAGSVSLGARLEFFKYYFIQGNAQLGRSIMPDILLEIPKASRASQNITFFEGSWAVGGYIPLVKADKTATKKKLPEQ